jgi:DNA polymerase I-like protein with 3'-5' exonuclease and polymerase domains
MKKAMVEAWEAGCFSPAALGAPHLTVHDELDGSTPGTPAAIEARLEVKRIMETCVKLLVPLRADGGIGPNWGQVKEAA